MAVPLDKLPVEAKIRHLWRSEPEDVVKVALAVSQAENGLRTCDRVHINNNGTKDVGIFQINSIHSAKGDIYDCEDNIRVALQIYKRQGWSPWVAYTNGNYKKFLK